MDDRLDILYLDNHLLVVNKPPGLLVQEDATGDPDVLSLAKRVLKQKFDKPGNVFVGLVHRLDRPASGVLVLARTSKAAARLSDQFRRRVPEKDYLALVEGTLDGAGLARDFLLAGQGSVRTMDASTQGARAAEMQWRAVGTENDCSLVAVRLKTGRKHQIRVQLAHMGHPILGDFRYGAKREFDGKNLALHSYRLGLTHPVKKEWMTFTAPAPASWSGRFEDSIRSLLAGKDR